MNELQQYEQFLNEYKNMTDDEIFNMIEDAVCESIKKSTKRQAKNKNLVKASDLKVGSQCKLQPNQPCSNGYLFDVIEVVRETSKTITVRLASDFSMMKNHWACNGGVLKTFRKSSLLYGMA